MSKMTKSIRELIADKGFEDRARPAGTPQGAQGREIVHIGTGLSLGIWTAQSAVEDIIHGMEAVR